MNQITKLLFLLFLSICLNGCSMFSKKIERNIANKNTEDESIYNYKYDPGPLPNSTWSNLINATPKHGTYKKAYSKKRMTIDKEKTSPVWYRGRLSKNSIKVLVIGEDRNSDQFVANRAFMGQVGKDMQNFLKNLGITKSYLFLNVIPYKMVKIKRYTPRKRDISNGEIIKHRHKVFNYAVEHNKTSLSLIIAVGKMGKIAVKKWLNKFNEEFKADGFTGQNYIKGVNVFSIDSMRDKNKFPIIEKKIIEIVKQDHEFFTADDEPVDLENKTFKIDNKITLPPKDFSFGTLRKFHNNIELKNFKTKSKYEIGPFDFTGLLEIYAKTTESVQSLINDEYFKKPTPKFIINGLYRGDLYKPTLVILADQFSPKDLETTRALSGHVGILLQNFLKDAGIYSSYVVINPIPINNKGISTENQKSIARNRIVSNARGMLINEILTQDKTKIVLSLGEVSENILKEIIKESDFQNIPIINLKIENNKIYTSNKKESLLLDSALTGFTDNMKSSEMILPEEHFPY